MCDRASTLTKKCGCRSGPSPYGQEEKSREDSRNLEESFGKSVLRFPLYNRILLTVFSYFFLPQVTTRMAGSVVFTLAALLTGAGAFTTSSGALPLTSNNVSHRRSTNLSTT